MKNFIQEFDDKNLYLENCIGVIKKKTLEKKDLEEKVHLRQIKLEDIFKENYSFFYSHHFQMQSNRFKNVSECLLELIRTINTNQSSSEYVSIRNNSPLVNHLLIDFKVDEFFKTSVDQAQMSNSFKVIFNDYLRFGINEKSKAFVFESLLNSYVLLNQKLKNISKSDSNLAICNSTENLTSEYKKSLNQCINNDRSTLEKYLNEILKRISVLDEKYNVSFINEVNKYLYFNYNIIF